MLEKEIIKLKLSKRKEIIAIKEENNYKNNRKNLLNPKSGSLLRTIKLINLCPCQNNKKKDKIQIIISGIGEVTLFYIW